MHSSREINDTAFYNGRRDAYRRIISSIDYISEKSHIAKPFVGKLIHHLQGVREQTVAVFFADGVGTSGYGRLGVFDETLENLDRMYRSM